MRNSLSRRFSALLVILALFAGEAARSNTYVYITEKQTAKEKNRWSLSDWLDTRDRMRAMDLWLSLHSPSPYEFYLGTAYKTGKLTAGNYYGGWDFFFAAYAYLFGLEIQRQTSTLDPRWVGLVNFRAYGYHNQATNLTFQGGVKNESRGGTSLWNPLVGVSLTLYVAKNFGLEGMYRHTFSSAINGVATANDRFEGGAFIDFSFVRVFGDYFSEVEAGNPLYSSSGAQLGTRLYF